ncbi:MAG: protein-glutamate O-methyltransferase CheR [bacterium]
MALATGTALSAREFQAVSELMYRVSGVNLTAGKEGLVESRLASRLRALQLDSYSDYLAHVEQDRTRAELTMLVDLLTTNKTSFFREAEHFEYLKREVLPRLNARGGAARFWCAGCSSGEEPYSLAMLLTEDLNAPTLAATRILATDLSTRILAKAEAAEYDQATVDEIGRPRLARHFEQVGGAAGRRYRVRETVRRMVKVARLNLMGPWPMKGPFDVIMCRNVMIYFDAPTQERLINRFHELLAPGGSLLVGHSESLTALSHNFSYVQPATYVK